MVSLSVSTFRLMDTDFPWRCKPEVLVIDKPTWGLTRAANIQFKSPGLDTADGRVVV